MFLFCQSHVSFYSTLIGAFQAKLSIFFTPSSFRWEADAAVEPLSSLPALLTNFSFDWTSAEKKMMPDAGIRPLSSPIGDTAHESLKRLCPPNSFSRRQREQWLRDGTSECRMKPADLRLESLSGIFHCFCSAQGTKPKCCHLHIFLVQSKEKSGEHFGEHLN